MRSLLLATVAALVFAVSAPPARAAAEAPPPTGKTAVGETHEVVEEVWWVNDPNHKERKWIVIGAAAAAVALVGVLAARWAKAVPPTSPPAA